MTQELARDAVDRHRSMGAFGKPVYQSHTQLRALLQQRRRPGLADYFARPHFDADSGEIRWTTELPGSARRRTDLDAEAQARVDARLIALHDELDALGAELRGQGGGAASFASVIEQAAKVPAEGDFVHVVGDQPVIAFWGFEDANGRSVDPSLEARARAALPLAAPATPSSTPTAAVTTPPPAHAPAAFVPEPPAAAAPAVALAKPRGSRWPWLLLLLLPLLLALAWMLSRCNASSPIPLNPDGVPKTAGRDAVAPLDIPPGALERGDLSFLEGVWQLGEHRVNVYEGRPDNVVGSDRVVLRFERDGSGDAHLVERLRRGAAAPDCSAKLAARTDGKKLYFERVACATPGRRDLEVGSSRHECVREANGRTLCYGVNTDGVRWAAPLKRLQ